jgi:hypothetical protein
MESLLLTSPDSEQLQKLQHENLWRPLEDGQEDALAATATEAGAVVNSKRWEGATFVLGWEPHPRLTPTHRTPRTPHPVTPHASPMGGYHLRWWVPWVPSELEDGSGGWRLWGSAPSF